MRNIYHITFFIILILGFTPLRINASIINLQDTISGKYNNLLIKEGVHYINETVTIKNSLIIEPGTKIEFSGNGVIVCEGEVLINGDSIKRIEIYGKHQNEGLGIVIRNSDTSSRSKIEITKVFFSDLQQPIFFDFGWKRRSVNIANNMFMHNIGRIAILQVLNPPFNLNLDTNIIDFKLKSNIFSDNNAGVYFEDFKNNNLNIEISNNVFFGNSIYGTKYYIISTNVLYGRADNEYSKFDPKIINNSFKYNYFIDNSSDTIVKTANFGVYGTVESFNLKYNYFGSDIPSQVSKGIYDQSINFNVPRVDFIPFLNKPNASNPTHIYKLNFSDGTSISDTIKSITRLTDFSLISNAPIDYDKSIFKFIYFKDDSTLIKKDSIILFESDIKGLEGKIQIKNNLNNINKVGYLELSNIKDANGYDVPNIKIGYLNFLKEYYRRKLYLDSLVILNKSKDSINTNTSNVDSVKDTFQKIENSFKRKIEIGFSTGGAIFLGTISNKGSLFSNDMNTILGLHVNYILNSKLSTKLEILNFKLSNSDLKSNNNEQLARGMSFKTNIISFSQSLNYDFIDNRLYTKSKKIRPSIGFGMDVINYTPTGIYNGITYNLQQLGTGGQFSDSVSKPYSTLTFGYFFNINIKYQINKLNNIGFNLSYHNSFSNYLDDVGPDPYPTIASILKSKIINKDAAIYFSNTTSKNALGQYRNSPDAANDSYLNFGIYYSRKLFK